MVSLFFAAALLQENPYGAQYLDPGAYGIEITFPDGYELVLNESGAYRLAFRPKADGRNAGPFVRIRLAMVKEEPPPVSDADWDRLRRDTVRGYREDYPGGVRVVASRRIILDGRPVLEISMELKEADGRPFRGRCLVFHNEGRRWALDLRAEAEAFDDYQGAFEAVRSSLALSVPASRLWLYVILGAVAAAGLAWFLFLGRREEAED